MKVTSPISNQYLTQGKDYDVINIIKAEELIVGAEIVDDLGKQCKIILIEECPHLHNQSFHWIIKESHDDYLKEAWPSRNRENFSRPFQHQVSP